MGADSYSHVAASALCRFQRNASVAELTVSSGGDWHRLQLEIDHAVVFRCEFGHDTGLEQLTALACTTRRELEQRGWLVYMAP